jgi:hypothetical protein
MKKHNTFPAEQPEMPVQPERPEIPQPGDPDRREIPKENNENIPDELPPPAREDEGKKRE